MLEKLKYPVIAISKKGYLSFARVPEEITHCSIHGLKNGFYNGLTLIDSFGVLYEIDHAEKIATVGPFGGLSLKYTQRIKIKPVFSDKIINLDLECFKQKVINAINKNKDFWISGGDFKESVSFIINGNSIEQIIIFLSYKFYKAF